MSKVAKHKGHLLQKVKKQFTAGIVAIVPISLSVYVLWTFFTNLDRIIGRQIERFFGIYIYGIGFVILILVIWLTGLIASGYLGSKFMHIQERMVTKIPVLGTIFKTLKQLSESVFTDTKSTFKQAVLVEVFNKGCYSIGFITSKQVVRIVAKKKDIVHVFVPTAINPVSGFLILHEESKLIKLNITVEEAIKTVVAAGMVYPPVYK